MPFCTTTMRTLILLAAATLVAAHKHHDHISEEDANKPVDAILWIHIFLQAFVWGVLFPVGMVLGLAKSRWHVPLQSTGFALTAGGYVLGHSHKGRAFLASAHGKMASIMFIPIALQLGLGIYLKLHLHEKTLRPWAVKAHSLVGKVYPIIGWVQMLFGAIAFRGYCRGSHLGQCLAHYIMGSAFIAYGCTLAILLLVGEAWIRRSGKSPEWWDSWVITLWGILNTFTEHHGGEWSRKDMQHTVMGVIWWAGGMLGIFLARNNQRNVIPSIVIIVTGWAMSDHAQALMISTKVHAIFGDTLMMAGVTRIIEICFFSEGSKISTTPATTVFAAEDDNHSDHTLAESSASGNAGTGVVETGKEKAARAWKHLTPFLLVASGVLFMSATDEELEFVHGYQMDHATYAMIMYSLAFLIYLLIIGLVELYSTLSARRAAEDGLKAESFEMGRTSPSEANGHSRRVSSKWYARVPATEPETPGSQPTNTGHHIIGDDED